MRGGDQVEETPVSSLGCTRKRGSKPTHGKLSGSSREKNLILSGNKASGDLSLFWVLSFLLVRDTRNWVFSLVQVEECSSYEHY